MSTLDLVYTDIPAGFTLTLPIIGGTVSEINWGPVTLTDGNTTYVYVTAPTSPTTVSITGTDLVLNYAGSFITPTGQAYLTSCTSFGSGVVNVAYAFFNCPNLTSVPATLPGACTDLSYMFFVCTNFNSPNVSSWDTALVTNMGGMFRNATSFNQPLTTDGDKWNVSSVQDFSSMFSGASAFNQNIGSWQVDSAINLSDMLTNSGLSPTNYSLLLDGWAAYALLNPSTFPTGLTLDATPLTYTAAGQAGRNTLTDGFGWTIYDGGLVPEPLVLVFTDIPAGFTLTLPITGGSITEINWGPETTGLGVKSYVYASSGTYTVSILGTGFRFTYYDGTGQSYLTECTNFGNGLTDASFMFYSCANLTSVPATLPATITNLSAIFNSCTNFNSPNVSNWVTTNVTTMYTMFESASSFNQPLNTWNTVAVENMSQMFQSASSFNQPLNTWNTAAVENMENMFRDATSFNQPLTTDGDKWNVSSVVNFSSMFLNASAFNQNIGSWQLDSATSLRNMLTDSGLSPTNYSNLLDGWAAYALTNPSTFPTGLILGATPLTYTAAGQAGRNTLTDPVIDGGFGWAINDGGVELPLDLVFTNIPAGFTLTLPITGGSISSINWGPVTLTDGVTTYVYATSGTYTVSITGTGYAFNYDTGIGSGQAYLTECTNFGTGLTSGERMFFNCQNLTSVPATLPAAMTNLSNMFNSCSSFNSPNVSSWDTQFVTRMVSMFIAATSFNQPLNTWNTAAVENMAVMFYFATSFNQNIGSWHLDSATNLNNMLVNSGLSPTNYTNLLNGWAAYALTNPSTFPTGLILGATPLTYTAAGQAGRNTLTDGFGWTINDGGVVPEPLVLVFTDIPAGFTLTLPIVGGSISSINWGPASTSAGVTSYTYVTAPTSPTTVSILGTGYEFDYSSGTPSGQEYLTACTSFGNAITTAYAMFFICPNLTSVPATLPASITSLSSTFYGCTNFNSSNVSSWDTQFVTNMSYLFTSTAFNQPLNTWNTAAVTTMQNMFQNATSFNQPLSTSGNLWNVYFVQDFSSMFSGASAFNQNIGSWQVDSAFSLNDMLTNSGLSPTNYSLLLDGWAAYALLNPSTFPTGRLLDATPLTYTAAGQAGRNTLTDGFGWTIYDGGLAPPPPPCFKEGSKILTDKGYLPIETLRKGDLVKTLKNGYKTIDMIGKRVINNPAIKERVKEQLYKCSKDKYPELTEDLVITGCHSILVDRFTSQKQREKVIEVNGDTYVTDKKYRLPACADERASVYENKGDFTIYHIALENSDYYANYGVYANGLLVETCSKRYLKELSKMELI